METIGTFAVDVLQRVLAPAVRIQLQQIYEGSFPSSERLPFDDLVKGLEDRKRWGLIATLGEDLLGFLIGTPLQCAPAAFLAEYLAVKPNARQYTVAHALIRETKNLTLASGSLVGVIAEVERPLDMRTAGRLNLYQRHGGQIIECAPAYRMPNQNDGSPLPMTLVWFGIKQKVPPRGDELKRFIAAIYQQSYGISGDNRLLSEVLGEVAY